ncbi:MAG TPA: c-type cytochrome, partial [Oceanospirillales bacterium]|nr:c-type cytochrome [Oceanospirillales bacterium]
MKTFKKSLLIAGLLAGYSINAADNATAAHKAEMLSGKNLSTQIKLGESLFNSNCAACHQTSGKGMSGVFPPLAGSDYLLADKSRAINTVIGG